MNSTPDQSNKKALLGKQERVNIESVAIEFEIILNIVKHMSNELSI